MIQEILAKLNESNDAVAKFMLIAYNEGQADANDLITMLYEQASEEQSKVGVVRILGAELTEKILNHK